jgi:hypothetical protein
LFRRTKSTALVAGETISGPAARWLQRLVAQLQTALAAGIAHPSSRWIAGSQPGARIEDVSRLLGHSTVRVTQDLYIAPDGDLYHRFYTATE